MADVSNSDDVVDIRDIIERFEELESEREDLVSGMTESNAAVTAAKADEDADLNSAIEAAHQAGAKLAEWDEDNADELNTLRELLDELKGYGGDHQWQGDWYPGSLIRETYFEAYAEQLGDDLGAIDRNEWPLNCIDWKRAARELQVDYSSVEWGGETYWYR